MLTFRIMRCTRCDCAVQKGRCDVGNQITLIGSDDQRSSELGSDRFVDFCRGQGKYYSTRPDAEIPPVSEHFNFAGYFMGMCCHCALMRGLCIESFISVGCYHCKQRLFVWTEFSKLKKKGKGASIQVWSSNGWAGLSDNLIDYILKMVFGPKFISLMSA
jgi:hypothetical protein